MLSFKGGTRMTIKKSRCVVMLGAMSLVLGLALLVADDSKDTMSDGKGIGTILHPGNGKGEAGHHGGGGGNGISYHGGPLILGTTNVYFIWYGNWSKNTATTILPALASSIGGSPYFNINTTYFNGAGTHVSNSVAYAGSTTDSYSHGTSLADADIQA